MNVRPLTAAWPEGIPARATLHLPWLAGLRLPGGAERFPAKIWAKESGATALQMKKLCPPPYCLEDGTGRGLAAYFPLDAANLTADYNGAVLTDGALEASYPSSHTMLVICIMGTAIMQFRRLLPEKKGLRIFLDGAAVLLIVVTVVGRLLSGVHWFTDILAGVLLSSALVMLYFSALTWLEEKVRR